MEATPKRGKEWVGRGSSPDFRGEGCWRMLTSSAPGSSSHLLGEERRGVRIRIQTTRTISSRRRWHPQTWAISFTLTLPQPLNHLPGHT